MVQGRKSNVKRMKQSKGSGRKRYTSARRKRGVAPKKGIKRLIQSKHERKVSVAINKNIEQIMAARLASEGGRFTVLKNPTQVAGFVKTGPSFGKKAKPTFSRAARRKTKERKQLEAQLRKLESETGGASSSKKA